MRKFYQLLLVLFVCASAYAQSEEGVITLTTSHQLGEEITLYPTPVTNGDTIRVDWGDGEIQKYKLGLWNKNIRGNKAGEEIKIYTQLKSFDCSETRVTSLRIAGQPGLENLECYKNELTRDNLDVSGAPNLVVLNCHNNKGLLFLNLQQHTRLTTLECYSYDEGTITTILLPESGSALEILSAYNNDISALNVGGCPNLTELNMENNALMEIDVTGCPELNTLNISGNGISALNLSKNSKLEKLFCMNNLLTELDLFANKELLEVYCSDNQLPELDLSENGNLTQISCENNLLTKLDVRHILRLKQLKCSGNQLSTLDLSGNFYLQKIWCKSNRLTFLDFFENQNLNYIDCRDNAGMTPCALNYMYSTLTGLESTSPNKNLLIEGCNGETSDTGLATEFRWTPDVTGDGSAECGAVELTVLTPENGTFVLSQPELSAHTLMPVTDNKVQSGVPVYVQATPAEGYKVKSVLVNNRAIGDSIFVTSEPDTVTVIFAPETGAHYITMEVETGAELSFGIGGTDPETEVEIDWGNGKAETAVINDTNIFRIEGIAKGTLVKISGSLDYLDCSENDLIALDVTHNSLLKTLDCYWTGITELDLSQNPVLGKLNCSYNTLQNLDLSGNAELFSLTCYNCELGSLDLSHNPLLEEVTAKNNDLTTLDLSMNTKIVSLDIQNNRLATVDVSVLPELESFLCSGNGMSELNVTGNKKLSRLTCSNNLLTSIDLSENALLERLFCDGNRLQGLDVSGNERLNYIECSGNSMSACALNDFYYTLPFCSTPSINLFNYGTENPNDADHSETAIAVKQGWKVSAEGDGSGCDEAYLTIVQPENGIIELYINDGQQVESGTKVTKNTVVEVNVKPEEGYELEYVKANGVNVTDNKFTVTVATEVTGRFAFVSGIEENFAGIRIGTAKNEVHIVADQASVIIYTTTGIPVYEGTVNGETSVPLSGGSYVIRVIAGEEQVTRVVLVK